MARYTLFRLSQRVRLLVGDTHDPNPTFDDADYQAVLDESRVEVRWMALRPAPSFSPSGIQYLDFYAGPGLGFFEDDYLLQDASYADITSHPTVAETDVGHWRFSTQPQGLTVRITGKSFDPYAAAVGILERWAAQVARAYDFTNERQEFKRSQQQAQLLALAQTYRQQVLPRTGRLTSTDVAPEGMGSGPSVVYPTVSPSGW